VRASAGQPTEATRQLFLLEFVQGFRAGHKQTLLVFYDFQAEHWMHLGTTNPIESLLATVRLRTDKTKGTRLACFTKVFKLLELASKHWRVLNGSTLLRNVLAGIVYVNGGQENRPLKKNVTHKI
jgi:putative transposase